MDTFESPLVSEAIPNIPCGITIPLKIALLLLTAISCHYPLTPPHEAMPKTVVVNKSLFERGILWVAFCSRSMVWLLSISDAMATHLAAYHKSAASATCLHPTSPYAHPLLAVLPVLVLGAFTAAFANLLRQWCFRALGPLFAFEITIQPEHRLITWGPYAVIRHPSYAGVYLTLLGSAAVAFAPGAWLSACWCSTERPGFGHAVVWLLVAFRFAKLVLAFRGTYRLSVEDEELHHKFGGTWEEYAERVRWTVLPRIYVDGGSA